METNLQRKINQICLNDGGKMLKPFYRKDWDATNPTWGYCYIVTEMIYHYLAPEGFLPYCISFKEDNSTHWYLLNKETNEIIDGTSAQFLNEKIPYENGVRKAFFIGSIETDKGKISKRAAKLYEEFKKLA